MCLWYVHVCLHVCAQKNERLTRLSFSLAHFLDLHFVVISFVALSSCAEFYFLYYVHYSFFKTIFPLPPPPPPPHPHIFVTHDETNQAKRNKLSKATCIKKDK